MSAKAPPKVGTRIAVLQVLAANRSRKGMAVSEVIDAVLATPGVKLKGKTPRATVNALFVSMVQTGEVVRPDRGRVAITATGRQAIK